MDLEGHGASDGDRCYFPSWDDVVNTVVYFITKHAPAVDGPRFLLGHSLGGLTALHVAVRTVGLWNGVILSGPALQVDPSVNTPVNRFLARALSSLLPKVPIQALDAAKLCGDQEVVARYLRDPLNYSGGVRARVGCEVLRAIEEAQSFPVSFRHVPLLIVHGREDTVCLPSGSEDFVARVRAESGDRCDVTLRIYPGLLHEVFNEREGPKVLGDVVTWIEKHM